VTTKKEIKQYVSSTGGPFKTKWCGHTRDLKVHKGNGTELSKFIWNLKTLILITTLIGTFYITSERFAENLHDLVPMRRWK